jgi:hypothetical protein
MRLGRGKGGWRAVALALLLSGCAGSSGPPPITSLEDRGCAPTPDLSTARPVFLSADKPVTVDLDRGAACLALADGSRGVYAVFALPESATPYLVTVASLPQGETLFSPRATVLDASGAMVQELPRGAFMFHGATLSVAFRTHGQERFVVVTSDSGSVGQQQPQLASGVQATPVVAGPVIFFTHSGWEKSQNYTYAYNGRVSVSAQPVPTAN